MAKSVKSFRFGDYLAFHAQLGGNVERMSPRAMKAYLQFRLRLIEVQIQHLSNRLGIDAEVRHRHYAWSGQMPQDERWVSLANLDYLLAAREALVQTIDTL